MSRNSILACCLVDRFDRVIETQKQHFRAYGEIGDEGCSVPLHLRREIAERTTRRLLLRVQLFRLCDDSVVLALCDQLRCAVCLKNDLLVRSGETCDCLYV